MRSDASLHSPRLMLVPFLLVLSQSAGAADPHALDVLLRRHAAAGFTGSVLVARGGEPLVLAGHGFADFDAGRPNDADTLFEIASITKCFTAAAVVRLDQQGELDLDDSIAVHLPGVPPHSRAITVRQLLAHTSGIPRGNTKGRGEDLSSAVVGYLGDGPAARPGSRYEYWNGGYALLAGVIERASGKEYVQYMEEEILAPAGMGGSGFTGAEDLPAERAALGASAHGAGRSALAHPYGSYGYQYRGMGGLVTSVRELLAWDRALAGTELLDAEHRAELFTEVRDGYALGWFVGRAVDGSPRQSHGGAVRGFVAELRRYPQHDACIAVLSNRDDVDARAVAEDLESALLGRTLAYPALPAAYVDAVEADAIAGTYAAADGRLVVRAAGGVLVAGIEGQELIEDLGANEPLDWDADRTELALRATLIVESIARGDTEPLRTHMSRRIPPDWPARMRSSIWPAVLAQRGEFRGARPLGVATRDDLVEVLLAVEHANGPARALIAFGPAGLERLDWNGPQFVASARLDKLRAATFRLQVGPARERIEFQLEEGRAVRARVAGRELRRL
jgi:CubicO group peptidase (beta-lactamase class C family)